MVDSPKLLMGLGPVIETLIPLLRTGRWQSSLPMN
jgi:hypothetical protein